MAVTTPFDVMVVDDEPTTRQLVTGVLRRAGISAIACADGAEMWAICDRQAPRLVILDVEMPGDDGFMLAEKLRARYGLGVSIVMLTSHDKTGDKAVGMDIGVDDYLTKPCDWKLLIALVSRYLRDGC